MYFSHLGVVLISVSVDVVVITQRIFSHLGVFLISVKPMTTENTESKTTPKISKITVTLDFSTTSRPYTFPTYTSTGPRLFFFGAVRIIFSRDLRTEGEFKISEIAIRHELWSGEPTKLPHNAVAGSDRYRSRKGRLYNDQRHLCIMSKKKLTLENFYLSH